MTSPADGTTTFDLGDVEAMTMSKIDTVGNTAFAIAVAEIAYARKLRSMRRDAALYCLMFMLFAFASVYFLVSASGQPLRQVAGVWVAGIGFAALAVLNAVSSFHKFTTTPERTSH